MSIKENLNTIESTLPNHVTLVAVSKTKPVSAILEAYNAGQRIFGENKVQDMVKKHELLPKDIQWHMIGHMQRNKIKYISKFVSLIHGVDSLKLLKEINKHAIKHNHKIQCLLQIKIAKEDSKFGLSKEQALEIFQSKAYLECKNVSIVGLMGMASFTNNLAQIKAEFKYLKSIFDELKLQNSEFKILSMGMSGDYKLAIDCGSTMVRIGSRIFGERNYAINL